MKPVQLFFTSVFLLIVSFTFAQPSSTNFPTNNTFGNNFRQSDIDLSLKKEQNKLRQNIKRIEKSNILPEKELKTTIPKLIEIDKGISQILNKEIKKTDSQKGQLVKELYKFNDFLFNIDMGIRLNDNQRQFFFGKMNTIHYYISDSVPLPMAQVCLDIAKLNATQVHIYTTGYKHHEKSSYNPSNYFCELLYLGQHIIVIEDNYGNIYEYTIRIDNNGCSILSSSHYRIPYLRRYGSAPRIYMNCQSLN